MLELELLWLPLCVMMVWLSWLLHHKVKGVASVFCSGSITMDDAGTRCSFIEAGLSTVDFVYANFKNCGRLGPAVLVSKKWITWVAT